MNLLFYLKNALRKKKLLSITFIIRMISVVVGALSISVIISHIFSELGTDHFFKDANQIYAHVYKQNAESNWRGGQINESEVDQTPEFDAVVNIEEYSGSEVNIRYGENSWTSNGFKVSPNFFDVLHFDLISGESEAVFDDPMSVILSKQLAEQIFGKRNPIGEVLHIQVELANNYTVRGVYELPGNCSMDFNFLIPSTSTGQFGKLGMAFVKLKSPVEAELIDKVYEATKNHFFGPARFQTDLIPLTNLYFDERNLQSFRIISQKGNIRDIYIFAVICLIIGFVVVLNCAGLKFSEDFDQRHNNALRRVCGATVKHQLFHFSTQLCMEFTLALSTAMIFFIVLQPTLQRIFGFEIGSLEQLFMLMSGSTIGILVVSYLGTSPLFYKTNYARLRMNESLFKNKILNRSWITVAQFGLTIFLIISALVVNRQYQSMIQKDLGFDSNNVLVTNLVKELPKMEKSEEAMKKYEAWNENIQYMFNELDRNPHILSFARGNLLKPYPMDYKKLNSQNEFKLGNTFTTSPGFETSLGLKLKEGRFFDRSIDKSHRSFIVINETAKKKFDIQDIAVDRLRNATWGHKQIIGVVEDFHYEHLASEIKPLVFNYSDDPGDQYLIKIAEGAEEEAIQFLEKMNAKLNPGLAFNYSFLDDDLQALYEKEKKLGTIYFIFTVIICLISAMGLFAFAYRSIQHRVKEIGIRKVNGAKVTEVLALLNKDIIKWISVSFLLAAPLSWYFMDQWLKNFAFRINLDWWLFIGAGLLTLIIAVLTISYITWKAATRNPVEALRYE